MMDKIIGTLLVSVTELGNYFTEITGSNPALYKMYTAITKAVANELPRGLVTLAFLEGVQSEPRAISSNFNAKKVAPSAANTKGDNKKYTCNYCNSKIRNMQAPAHNDLPDELKRIVGICLEEVPFENKKPCN